VEFKDSDRLHTRLFAINLRLAELNQEMERTQIRVHHLESALADAQLARLMGEEAGSPSELGTELERSRGNLESQREVVARVKASQWKARVEYMLVRAKERRDARASEAAQADSIQQPGNGAAKRD
jgi:hypothetical protein